MPFKIKNFRWWIVGLVALATAINYLDRQNLPVALSEIRKSFPVSDADYGMINSLFLLAYGTMYAVGGRIIDILGSKKGYAIMIIWWSLASMLHALVSGIAGLAAARFLLGIGEGGAFPGSAKVVSEWFGTKERSLAFGIFNTGSSLGAVMAPPLIAMIISWQNWRWTFLVTGVVGLVWVMVWLKMYTTPARSTYLTNKEKDFVDDSLRTSAGPKVAPGNTSLQHLLSYRKVWGLLIAKFLADAGWYFFIFWLPKYLNDIRGLDISTLR